MIPIVQFGVGPLGRNVLQYLLERKSIQLAGVVDLDPDLAGRDAGALVDRPSTGVVVSASLQKALQASAVKPRVAVLTTVSSVAALVRQVRVAAEAGMHIVSTCEELLYPWNQHPDEAREIDRICRDNNVACLGTGVNPGFLMDYLPAVFTATSRSVERITVERVQDASTRRIPFQKKIGAGLTPDEFERRKQDGTLRHVGLPESVDLIAAALGWKLDENRETLEPVLSPGGTEAGYVPIGRNMPAGVEQVGSGFVNGKEVIRLVFRAAVDEPRSYDRIHVAGEPDVQTEIRGGMHGDIATSAITVNAVGSIMRCSPGLKTMLDIPVPSWLP